MVERTGGPRWPARDGADRIVLDKTRIDWHVSDTRVR
jgi:hypothetical protein